MPVESLSGCQSCWQLRLDASLPLRAGGELQLVTHGGHADALLLTYELSFGSGRARHLDRGAV